MVKSVFISCIFAGLSQTNFTKHLTNLVLERTKIFGEWDGLGLKQLIFSLLSVKVVVKRHVAIH